MTRILGMDPSLTGFGWVVCDVQTEFPFAVTLVGHGTTKTTTKTPMPWRYKALREGLSMVFNEFHTEENPIDFIGIEHPPYRASYSAGLYALYMDCWESILDRRIPFVNFMPTQLKAYVKEYLEIEEGKISKQDVKDVFVEIFAFKGRFNNNVGDAGICAFMAARFYLLLQGTISSDQLTKYERHAFLKNTVSRKTKVGRKEGLFYQEGKDGKYFLYADSKYDKLYPNQ